MTYPPPPRRRKAITGVRYWRPLTRPRWTTMANQGRRPAKAPVTRLVTRRLKRPRARGNGIVVEPTGLRRRWRQCGARTTRREWAAGAAGGRLGHGWDPDRLDQGRARRLHHRDPAARRPSLQPGRDHRRLQPRPAPADADGAAGPPRHRRRRR